jgi:hypothetical protein
MQLLQNNIVMQKKEDLHGDRGVEFLLRMASYEPELAYLLTWKEGALQECLYIAGFSLLI